MKVSEMLVRSLEEYGTARAYGLIGTSILELMDAMSGSRIRYISTRHEQVTVSMADAEGRVTGRPGVAMVHGGPGFLNSLVSLSNAHKDGSPLLLVAGAVKRRLVGMDSWLEVPESEMTKSIVKRAFRIEKGGDAAGVFSEAYSLALSPPVGPVFVEVPEDVWVLDAGNSVVSLKPTVAGAPPEGAVRLTQAAILKSKRPLLIVGGGMNKAEGTEALTSLLVKAEIPVVTTGNGRGALPEDHPLSLGRIGFGGGSMVADTALAEADFVLCLGGGLSDVSTYGFNMTPKGEVFTVDLDRLWDRKPVAYSQHWMCDAPAFVKELAKTVAEYKQGDEWRESIQKNRRAWEAQLEGQLSREKPGFVNPARFLNELEKSLPRDVILAAGQGLHIVYAYCFLKVRSPASFLAATNMGSMGFVFAAALGAKVALPDREVVAVLGDGEFMMTVQDLETAAREKIGVRLIVINDNSYRVLLMRQKIQKMGRVFGTLHSNPDMIKLADAFGLEAMSVASNPQIPDAVRFLLKKTDRPLIVELKVDPEDLPPINPQGSLMF